jgi:hypothetical protein
MLAILFVSTVTALGQAGPNQANSLRGLKGVRLVIMFGRAGAIDEAERSAILKPVEADAIAKFEKAGIQLFHWANEMESAESPQLMVVITCDKANGHVYPVVVKAKLVQRVRLARDPSIEGDLTTWESNGIGDPLTAYVISGAVAQEIDRFISDFKSVNLTTARR